MTIQNHKIQFVFIDCFFTFVCMFLISLCYFSGFDITVYSLLFYLLSIFIVVLLCCIGLILFSYCYNSYTEISNNKIIVYKNKTVILEVDVKKIKYCKYESIWNLLLLDPKGGYYRVFYDDDNKTKCLFISLSNKQSMTINNLLKQ